MDILFVDNGRQGEIDTFYEACQRHRDYYRGYAKANHALLYFKDQEYLWQSPAGMTATYLGFPMYFVKYKQPLVLPSTGRTSGLPALPDRTLAGRFNKTACKAFVR
ncbi:uncharacterized protein LOC131848952 [Achroia grisella]|uniref:uncharacterized protein LOC131848952 n=1 Tax=Achroia grisella TaxID=688607 RepID=UPI0027D2DABC|nr:uncharacterized protein LOC131848952 [Achroia grisella]